MGIPIVAGRGFEAADRAGAPFVVVVNRAMAARYFPGQNPIGQAVRILGPAPRTIVGVIPDLRQRALQHARRARNPRAPHPVPHRRDVPGGARPVGSTRNNWRRPSGRRCGRSIAICRSPPCARASRLLGETLSSRRLSLVLLSVFAVIALVLVRHRRLRRAVLYRLAAGPRRSGSAWRSARPRRDVHRADALERTVAGRRRSDPGTRRGAGGHARAREDALRSTTRPIR